MLLTLTIVITEIMHAYVRNLKYSNIDGKIAFQKRSKFGYSFSFL